MSLAFDVNRWWPAPLLPRQDGRDLALLFVVAALSLLAGLAAVGALAGHRAAEGWRTELTGSATVVVRAQDDNDLAEAPAPLVQVVGAVGGEVGEVAVRADVDAVLVVAGISGAHPCRAFSLVDVARLPEPGQSRIELVPVMQFLLLEVEVETHAEAGQRGLDFVEHQRDALGPEDLAGG